ncbi:MAG: hypothetical protein QXP31_07210 [Pyrobaculum sp.]
MILGEAAGKYQLRDYYTYLLFDVSSPLGQVTVVPPPPGSSYQFAVFGALIAKMGYRTRVLNMSTCRQATISKVLSHATGELVYVGYAHRIAYAGPGASINTEDLTAENVKRVALGNIGFQAPWRRCLLGGGYGQDVVELGTLPEALERLEVWLAERLGRR